MNICMDGLDRVAFIALLDCLKRAHWMDCFASSSMDGSTWYRAMTAWLLRMAPSACFRSIMLWMPQFTNDSVNSLEVHLDECLLILSTWIGWPVAWKVRYSSASLESMKLSRTHCRMAGALVASPPSMHRHISSNHGPSTSALSVSDKPMSPA